MKSAVKLRESSEPTVTACDRSAPLRVLHLNAGNLYGGVETILTAMARRRSLCPGMEPHFGVCYEGRSSRELAAAGVPVYFLGGARLSRPWTVWRARRHLQEVLRREQFDAVICHMDWSLVVFGGAAQAAGKKLLLWAHGFPTDRNWLQRRASQMAPHMVIANSEYTANVVRSEFSKTRPQVNVVYCPVELTESPDTDEWRSAVRREYGVDDRTTVILQAGRLEAWKGQLLHLEALAQLKENAQWVGWIAGGPQKPDEEKYFQQLQQAAKQLGIADRVRFLGQRGDVPKLLAAADIFCQPNQSPEPFGIVFIEALSAGRPVVTTALGGALEIIDESCGLLTKPGDAAKLAEALHGLIQSPDLRRRLGAGGVIRARQLCDPASQLNKLKELLQGLDRTNE